VALKPLLWFHLLTHASAVPMLLYATPAQWTVAVLAFYAFGCWGVSITYHRLTSHKSFRAPEWFRVVGLLFGTLGGVGSAIQWTALHREHHRFADTERDPHLPSKGFWRMQFLAMTLPSSQRYVIDLLRDPVQVWFHKNYWLVHALYAAALLALDPFALVYAYLFPALVLWHTMASLGTFAHTARFGYQNHADNKARNLWPVGWLAFGEGWHNNHHAAPGDPQFGKRRWELDLSWQVIKAVRRVS
jgi:stearoyl-CoA desaturase (delta-9 desaturase)